MAWLIVAVKDARKGTGMYIKHIKVRTCLQLYDDIVETVIAVKTS